ncbi:hypothetical protein D3C73_1157190 [compost metagenome]
MKMKLRSTVDTDCSADNAVICIDFNQKIFGCNRSCCSPDNGQRIQLTCYSAEGISASSAYGNQSNSVSLAACQCKRLIIDPN